MLSHRTSGRAQCTQGGKLVSHWFHKGCLAELPVPDGGEAAEGPFQSYTVLQEIHIFLWVYKVSGSTVFGFGGGFFLAKAGNLCFTNVLDGFRGPQGVVFF